MPRRAEVDGLMNQGLASSGRGDFSDVPHLRRGGGSCGTSLELDLCVTEDGLLWELPAITLPSVSREVGRVAVEVAQEIWTAS